MHATQRYIRTRIRYGTIRRTVVHEVMCHQVNIYAKPCLYILYTVIVLRTHDALTYVGKTRRGALFEVTHEESGHLRLVQACSQCDVPNAWCELVDSDGCTVRRCGYDSASARPQLLPTHSSSISGTMAPSSPPWIPLNQYVLALLSSRRGSFAALTCAARRRADA